VGKQWCKFLFNLHHCGYAILTNHLNSSQDRPVAELVAATGSGISGAFTVFQVLSLSLLIYHIVLIHEIYTSTTFWPMQLPIGGACGLWSLPIRRPVRAGGISYEKPMNPFRADLILLVDKSYAVVALVYFFSMLPFFNRFCLTCTFFADCNEVEQE